MYVAIYSQYARDEAFKIADKKTRINMSVLNQDEIS